MPKRLTLECLNWLGLTPDEGPFHQSQRLELYQQWAQKLIDSGRAYADQLSAEQLEELRNQAKAARQPFLFRNHRPDNPPEWKPGTPLRFKSDPKPYQWHDAVMGELHSGAEVVDDFIIIKSDSYPTYNFAHIIDDHLMSISHVIRSQEFLPSLPNYLNLYEALDIKRPVFATLPYVLGPDGKKKLSKRDGAKDILDYQREGYLAPALVSFLASLGWNDGSQQEIFSIDELIKKFDLSRVQRSGAKFDERRLVWINGHFIRELPKEELYQNSLAFWPAEAKDADEGYKKAVLALVQERLKYLSELGELSWFFFMEPEPEKVQQLFDNPVDKQLRKLDRDEVIKLLKTSRQELENSDFTETSIAQTLNHQLTALATKPGILFAAIRIAVTGSQASPELFGSLSVIGKPKSLSRLDKAIELLEK